MRLEELWLRDARVCHLCLEEVEWREASRDHIIPRYYNGSNAPSNLKLAHKACNEARSAFSIDVYSVEEYRAIRASRLGPSRPFREQSRPRSFKHVPRWRCAWCGGSNSSAVVVPIAKEALSYRLCSHCQHRNYVQ